ncbi:MAG TPA: PAS domain S-box protein, partial [Prolixibacteraceae bacterium]
MKKQINLLTDNSTLRQRAEALLKRKLSNSGSQRSDADIQKLIHELEVHQIELEMQNEELRLAKEREAKLATEKYIELYDFAPSGYFTLSREGKIIDLNLSGAKMLGKERSYIKNSRFVFFVTDDTRSIFNLFLDRVFNSKSQQTGEVSLSAGNLTSYVHLTGIAAENREECFITAVDISDRKQMQDDLEKSRALLQAIIEGTPDSIYVKDIEGKYLLVNGASERITGKKVKDILGKDDYFLFPPEEAEVIMNGDRKVMKEGKVATYEETVTITSDVTIFLSTKGPIFDSSGNTVGLFGVARDITESKKAEEEIQKSMEIQQQFQKHLTEIRENERAVISREIHDQLGQSMTALKLDLNWLQGNLTANPEIKEKLSNMVALITATISHVQRISSELRPGILDDLGLAAAIEWYAEEFENRTKIHAIMDLDEVQTKSDPKNLAIFRVLQEALTNVIRHAKAKTLHITLHETSQ